MLEAIAVFLCQCGYVFLLGIQSRNVRDGQIISAAFVSMILGLAGLFMTSAIARAAIDGGSVMLAVAYVAAGPVGICLAICLHDWSNRRCEK